MFNLELDTNNDIIVVNNTQLSIINRPNYIAQKIASRIKTFRGEWFLDVDFGLPYFTDILIKTRDIESIDVIIRNIVLGTSSVSRIINYESELDNANRTFKVTTLDVELENGEQVSVGGVAI